MQSKADAISDAKDKTEGISGLEIVYEESQGSIQKNSKTNEMLITNKRNDKHDEIIEKSGFANQHVDDGEERSA